MSKLRAFYEAVVKGIYCPWCGAWPWSACYAIRGDWRELPTPHRLRVKAYCRAR